MWEGKGEISRAHLSCRTCPARHRVVSVRGGRANQRVICLGLPRLTRMTNRNVPSVRRARICPLLPPSRILRQGIFYEVGRCARGLSFKHTKSVSRVLLTTILAHIRTHAAAPERLFYGMDDCILRT